MTKELEPFNKQEWIDRLSHLIARGRVPSSTVYMDGSHSPRPSEIINAERYVNDLLDSLTNHLIKELK